MPSIDPFEYTHTILKKIKPQSASGYDKLPPKLVKVSAVSLAPPLTTCINKSFDQNVFPNQQKKANLCAIYKSKDNLNWKNYRPVSILPAISKVYEMEIESPNSDFFHDIFFPVLSAFWKMYNCQSALMHLVDRCENVGAIMMDLSKAFDCLSHELLIAKHSAYGFSNNSCNFIHNYLSN